MGRKRKDLTNQIFGRLLAIRFFKNDKHGKAHWKCLCDCGSSCIVCGACLISGNTRSCGCLHREVSREINTTHGLTHIPEYDTWRKMIYRCYNKKCSHYSDYGGRGITICNRWKESFNAFIEDIGERPSDRHSLERINNNKGYCKSNCKWAFSKEQSRNKRTNVNLKFNGRTMCIADWAYELGISRSALYHRYRKGHRPPELFKKSRLNAA